MKQSSFYLVRFLFNHSEKRLSFNWCAAAVHKELEGEEEACISIRAFGN